MLKNHTQCGASIPEKSHPLITAHAYQVRKEHVMLLSSLKSLQSRAVDFLTAYETNKHLLSLRVDNKCLGDVCGAAIAHALGRNQTLTELDASTNFLTSQSGAAIGHTVNRPPLRILKLDYNQLGACPRNPKP